jgi:four helix bundle protein
MTSRSDELEERLLAFSVQILKIVEQLPSTRTGDHVAGQLLRSVTSAYPDHGDTESADSRKELVHTLKELRQTQRCLKLIQRVPLVHRAEDLISLLQETDALIQVFVSDLKRAGNRP